MRAPITHKSDFPPCLPTPQG